MFTGPSSSTRALAPARDLLGVALGVGGGEPAAGVAGAGDEAGADRARLGGEAERLDGGLGDARACRVGHAGDQQVLPDGEADIAVAHLLRDGGEPAHLRRRELADRQHHADPVQAILLLLVDADMRQRGRTPAAARAPRPARGQALRRASPRPAPDICRSPMASSTYFIRALLRLVRSPWSMNTRTMASATLVASAGLTITPVSRAKSLWPVMPPSASGTRRPARRRSRPSPRRPGSRCRWCPPAPRSVPAPSKATLNLRGRP